MLLISPFWFGVVTPYHCNFHTFSNDIPTSFTFTFTCLLVARRNSSSTYWSEHFFLSSIPSSIVVIFPEGEDSRCDHGLGRLVEFRFKGPPGTTSSYITTHIIRTAPHGCPNLRSQLHCCHAQEGGPRSPQGHVVALDFKKILLNYPASLQATNKFSVILLTAFPRPQLTTNISTDQQLMDPTQFHSLIFYLNFPNGVS